MMNKMKHSQSGFTLIELLLYAGIVAIMTTAISGLLALSLQARVKNQVVESVESGAAIAMNDMLGTIRNGDGVTLTTDGNGDAIVTIATTNGGTNPIIFQLNSGVLTKKIGSAAAVAITSSNIALDNFAASDATPTGETAQSISLSFDVQYVNQNPRQEYHYSSSYSGFAQMNTP